MVGGKKGTQLTEDLKHVFFRPVYNVVLELVKTNTQQEVADMLGLPRTSVGNIINGGHDKVSIERIIQIANKLDIEYTLTVKADGVVTENKITRSI